MNCRTKQCGSEPASIFYSSLLSGLSIIPLAAALLFIDGLSSTAEAFRNSTSSSSSQIVVIDNRGPSLGQCFSTSGQYFSRAFPSTKPVSQARVGIDNGGSSNVGRNFRFTRSESSFTDPVRDASGSSNGSVNYVVESDAAATSGCNILNLVVEESVTPLPGDAWATAVFARTYSYTYQNQAFRYRLGFVTPGAQTYTAVRESVPLPAITGPANFADLNPFTVDVTFNEAVTGFNPAGQAGDLEITGGSFTVVGGSGTGSYQLSVTPDGSGNVTLVVPNLVAVNSTSDGNARSNLLTITDARDSVDPTVASIAGPGNFTDGSVSFDVTVTFDEPVDGFAAGNNVTLGNGTVGTITPVSPDGNGFATAWTVPVTPIDDSQEVTVDVAANAAQDPANNNSEASSAGQQLVVLSAVDNTDPSVVSITGPETFEDMAPIEVTITFSEPVDGFDAGTNVGLDNASVSSITPISPDGNGFATAWIVMVTPIDETKDITIDVLEGAAEDASDNPSAASSLSIQGLVKSIVFDRTIEIVEEILIDDLVRTTNILSANASNISRRAADRLRPANGQTCGLQINELLQASPVNFASASFVVGTSNDPLLREVAQILQQCADSNFMIAGHTDSDGSDAYNNTLSQNRVDAVRAALIRLGISDQRLQTRGFGEARPIATNATEAGKAQNRRVEFILLDETTIAAPACDAGGPLSGNAQGSANDQGVNLNGNFELDGYNCATGVRTETWGDVTVSSEDGVGTTGLATFGMSKETQANNVLNGRFVEAYLSQNSVDTDDATGKITGFGVHAGLYRSQALDGGLVFSIYGSAAVGQHSFDLDVGTDVDGNYTYAGVFAGASLGGQTEVGSMTVKPSAGVDLAYSEALGTEISVPGTLEIDPANVARGFVELGLEQAMEGGTATVTPRLFCEDNRDEDADACGYGGAFSYTSAADATGSSWDVAFDFEAIDERKTTSFSIARSQEIFDGLGVSKSSFGATQAGALHAEQTIAFNW